jgi:hypothetical protein
VPPPMNTLVARGIEVATLRLMCVRNAVK